MTKAPTKRIIIKRPKRVVKVARPAKLKQAKQVVQMSDVSTINTAPVAIGNSVRGASSVSTRTKGGVIVTGRDFMFSPIGTSTIADWVTCGGTPLTPVAFGDSTVRQYMQMYQKYRWKRCVVHYITSSATSSTGDVMFYHAKNRNSTYLNQTSSFLLPFVISDPDTVIGPQWTNHSADLHLQGTWKSTDYGMGDNVNDYADGEVFLLSKTTAVDAPGYVLFDYVIEFTEMQISPRLLSLPLPRAQYYNLPYNLTALAAVAGVTASLTVGGTGLNGSTYAFGPSAAQGDIYKIIIDVTNSTFSGLTSATLFQLPEGTSNKSLQLVDGTTIYGVIQVANTMTFFASATNAYAQSAPLQYGGTATATVKLQTWISLIGTNTSTNINPNF